MANKPTTEMVRYKKYRCRECGYEKEIQTNHYGSCYSIPNYNECPKCPPYKRPTIWDCCEKPPNNIAIPKEWNKVNIIRGN